MLMEDRFYTVVRIDGDYAVLLPDGGTAEDEFPVARALLPAEADEGVRLRYSMLEYTVCG